MKTYGGLYPQIYDFDNIHLAYLKARRNKRYKQEVLRFSARLEENLIGIQNDLIWKSYRPSRYKFFTIHEPICERSMIQDSFACRRGQGVLAGVLRTTRFLRDAGRRWSDVYCLKADVTKFFPSIDHETLKRILRRRIACPDTLDLIDTIIDSTETDRGLPIGSLTSQLWANVYLNELDHFVKETLRIRYYIRYMDDFVLFHPDKRFLAVMLEEITGFLENRLHLSLNGKTQIFRAAQRCVDFLGYRIRPNYRLLRKANVKRARRRFKKLVRQTRAGEMSWSIFRPHLASWMGHCRYADSYRIRNSVMRSAGILAETV